MEQENELEQETNSVASDPPPPEEVEELVTESPDQVQSDPADPDAAEPTVSFQSEDLEGLPTEEGNMEGEKDGGWILEKMELTGKGKSSKKKTAGKCGLSSKVDLNPSREGQWILDKMYRQHQPECLIPSEMPSALGLGPKYVNLQEPSNAYEKDGNWVLEKMGYGAIIKTSRMNCGGGPKPDCVNKRRVCDIARTMLVIYDTVTSCDIIGRNECDTKDHEPDMWSWLYQMVTGILSGNSEDNSNNNFSIDPLAPPEPEEQPEPGNCG